MQLKDFDYSLPRELIAQEPLKERDSSRLMVLDRRTQTIAHAHFYELPRYLQPGDLLVANDTRVIPARLYGKKETGGSVELLLLRFVEQEPGERKYGNVFSRAGESRRFMQGSFFLLISREKF